MYKIKKKHNKLFGDALIGQQLENLTAIEILTARRMRRETKREISKLTDQIAQEMKDINSD